MSKLKEKRTRGAVLCSTPGKVVVQCCATLTIPHINTIRTQACQSKLIIIIFSRSSLSQSNLKDKDTMVTRRAGRSSQKMSHSIKKVLRRHGAPGIKGKKAKLKAPSHPGAKAPTKKSLRDAEREHDSEQLADAPRGAAAAGTKKRLAARQEIGKKNRLEEMARRRGIDMSSTAAAKLQGSQEMEKDDDVDATAAATQAAKSALSFAPSSQRSFHKELATVLKSSDVILEVLDARDPMGCRCIPLEDTIIQRFQGKRVVLILNKVDLVPPQVHRSRTGPCVSSGNTGVRFAVLVWNVLARNAGQQSTGPHLLIWLCILRRASPVNLIANACGNRTEMLA